MKHELKTWIDPFRAIWRGAKKFEVRKWDRDFNEGDTVVLKEFRNHDKSFTGRYVQGTITYTVVPGEWGLPKDVGVFGFIEWARGHNSP
jgi:ribosomal protein S17